MRDSASRPIRVCLAGTFDPGFRRNRILRDLLERTGFELDICHVRLWDRREDHVVRHGKLRLALRALWVYPLLVWKFLRVPTPDVLLVAYPGHFDMPLIAPLARLRGASVLFDTFLSLFDTIVADRQLVSEQSLTARLAAWADRTACRQADLILVDTPQNGEYFAGQAGLPGDRFRTLWVGAEDKVFRPQPEMRPVPGRVLFYGTFIPLHGAATIVRAAKLLEGEGIEFRIIGEGQERPGVERLIAELGSANVEVVDPIPLEQLPAEIAQATLCLGIFGTTDKAHRVVPNKLFECLAMGRPVLTGDMSAIRAAFTADEVATVLPGDPEALAAAIRDLVLDEPRREAIARAGHARYLNNYGQAALAGLLGRYIEEIVGRVSRARYS
jgi:glycosyltransferase involved in cell wall biosynthesis